MEASHVAGGQADSSEAVEVDREECIVCGACINGCAGKARALVGRCMTVSDVMEEILAGQICEGKTRGGVTFSGGEPFMQSWFLKSLLKECKNQGISTAVDTSGYVPWEVIDPLRPWIDLFLFDLKFMDCERHEKFTGLPNQLILENMRLLSETRQPLVLRVPVIPDINDDCENHTAIAEFAASLPHLNGVELVLYQKVAREKYERLGKPYRDVSHSVISGDAVCELAQIYQDHGLNIWESPICPAD
jgi:pyruvate formate lyase activating enzyme